MPTSYYYYFVGVTIFFFLKILSHKEEYKILEIGEGDQEIAGEADREEERELVVRERERAKGFAGANDSGLERELLVQCHSG